MSHDSTDRLTRRTALRLAGVGVASTLAGCGGGGDGGGGGEQPETETEPTDGEETETPTEGEDGAAAGELEIVHWWTAGGEEEALQALIDGFNEANPDVEISNNPAPGGAGSALDTVIKNRVLNENPPSTFQIWPGQSLQPYVEADVLEPIGDSVWNQEMRDAYQPGVLELAQPGGDLVSVPLNIHRLNNLFYNVEVIESAGVDPSSIESPSDLLDAMETIDQETDAVPMAQQTQAPWSTIQLWENVLIGETDVDTYTAVLDGNVEDSEDAVKNALEIVTEYREYFNEDAGSISWDQANGKVIEGDAAMIHQGDWAAGQYQATEGFDYEDGWDNLAYPGTSGVYHVVSDSFVMPSPNPSEEATRAWLEYCGSVEGQEIFNPIKGSIPPRTDVPDDEFGPFLQSQMGDFSDSESQPPSIAHGTGVIPEVKSNIEGVFSGFIENWDVDQTYNQLTNAFEE